MHSLSVFTFWINFVVKYLKVYIEPSISSSYLLGLLPMLKCNSLISVTADVSPYGDLTVAFIFAGKISLLSLLKGLHVLLPCLVSITQAWQIPSALWPFPFPCSTHAQFINICCIFFGSTWFLNIWRHILNHLCHHTFSAFWLWSSVVSVLISVTTDMSPTGDLIVTFIFAGEVFSWACSRVFMCCARTALLWWQLTLWGNSNDLVFISDSAGHGIA